MEIRYSKKAAKYLEKQDKKTQHKLRLAIENLPNGDIKLYQSHYIITHRLRVGDYRVLYYHVIDNIIYIEKIGSRGDIYKGV